IRDPHYGDALFHFFQDHYFTSVTTLMTSQHFDRVAHHADEAEVLRGGMLLSYGLHREAGEIFAQLIEKGAEPPVRDRAWFYLAKIRYQRGYLDQAQDAIARIENHLPPELREERALLQANILMARADYAGAASALEAVDAKTPGARYARYNLGIALIKSGDSARGTTVLDELGRSGAENEEYRSLRDRANVALGFAALTENRPKDARTYLERVRLKSLHANKALLGFGWAAAALKDPKLALVPWLELAQRDVSDSAALEARIAVPYAYAELGAYGQSLERYQDAIGAFERETTGLDESIKAIRTGALVEALIERNPGDEMGWFWNIRELPEMPHANHLTQVLAQHEFQEAFKNYRDLRFLAKNLDDWREKLTVFQDMLDNRKKAYAERLPQVRKQAGELDLAALRKRREAVAAEVARGEADADGIAFADAKQTELLKRLADVQAALKGGALSEAELAPLRERARLAAGVLNWNLAQEFPARVWDAKKGLTAIDGQIEQAERLDAALAQAQRDEPARFERFAKRIAALTPLLDVMIPRVAALSKEQQGVVQDIAVAALTEQKERLAAYSTQARFAVAQLYDRATAGGAPDAGTNTAASKEADRAAKP
ncbi:MAG TPA: tetratricopeptide repeat protein, partial [Burkholderiaceae bacterium]|nr:tetratricopeptide repeat protein [Burkholderiaceae bacterium]